MNRYVKAFSQICLIDFLMCLAPPAASLIINGLKRL